MKKDNLQDYIKKNLILQSKSEIKKTQTNQYLDEFGSALHYIRVEKQLKSQSTFRNQALVG